jgi:hypothetical protein
MGKHISSRTVKFGLAELKSEIGHSQALAESNVRLQWDSDHNPKGEKVERRAIQLGRRGDVIAKYAREWILDVQDISAYVAEQREYAMSDTYNQLLTPRKDVYPVNDAVVAARLELSSLNPIASIGTETKIKPKCSPY